MNRAARRPRANDIGAFFEMTKTTRLTGWIGFSLGAWALSAALALGQTPTGFVDGQILGAAALNGGFAGKQDYPIPGFTAGDLTVGGGAGGFQDAASLGATATISAPRGLRYTGGNVTQAPASQGNWNSVLTACNGDLSHTFTADCQQITGSATLGQPAAGYVYTYEAYPHVGYLYNSSGFNHDTGGNGGRTAAVANHWSLFHAGQGDMVGYNVSCFMGSQALAGATSFLAEPACVLYNGDATAQAAGHYLNLIEVDANDGGFDAAAIALVSNMSRSVSIGALGATWLGARIQSVGSAAIDAAFSATGKINVGYDISNATLGANQAGITFSANQRWYLNSTAGTFFPSAVGTTYLTYNSSDSAVELVVGGVQQLAISTSYVGVVNKTAINSGDRFGVAGSAATNLGMSIDNSNSGTTAQTVLHFGNSNGGAQAGIFLNGGGFSGGQGANALLIFNSSTAPIVIGTGSEVIKMPSLATGTPAASICLDGSNNIIKKTTTGACI